MSKNKVPFYFVLYLVVLVELLAVIIERDNNEQELKERLKEYETIQDSVISLYRQPILLTVQEETDWLVSYRDSLHILISASNLQTPEEKSGVKYYVKIRSNENNVYYNVITDPITGNAHFYLRTSSAGNFTFDAYCLVSRKFPKYLPDIVLQGIFNKIGNDFTVSSDTVDFNVHTKVQLQNFDRPGRG